MNECLYCDCYDEDFGCTMSSIDKEYACPLRYKNKGYKILMEFFMPMIPPTVTAQEHKVRVTNGKPVFYDTPEIKNAKYKLISHLSRYKPEQKYDYGVRLIVKWLFPKGDKHADGEYRITKPDTDNLQKMLKDCMTQLSFWKDDCLVASEVVEKFWAERSGIYIRIEKLT